MARHQLKIKKDNPELQIAKTFKALIASNNGHYLTEEQAGLCRRFVKQSKFIVSPLMFGDHFTTVYHVDFLGVFRVDKVTNTETITTWKRKGKVNADLLAMTEDIQILATEIQRLNQRGRIRSESGRIRLDKVLDSSNFDVVRFRAMRIKIDQHVVKLFDRAEELEKRRRSLTIKVNRYGKA